VKQNASFDSSFWINADRAGLLSHVLHRYELRYAPAVAAELREEFPSGQHFWRLVREGVLTESAAGASHVQGFGPGERAAMDLAIENPGWVLLMDDQRPFQEAVRLGIDVLCTPVLVVGLFTEGALSAKQALLGLARLAALQTLSPHLLAAALAQLGRSMSERGEEDRS
jgi:predicted nucleic acid-binding protein